MSRVLIKCDHSIRLHLMKCQIFSIRRTAMQRVHIVNGQPQAPGNIFALAPSEQVHRIFVKKPGGCECGPTYTVTLTDARLLQRYQEFACCGQGARLDQMLFLSDISAISDYVAKRSCCPSCSLCCILFCLCALCCKCSSEKLIGIRGAFGEEVFVFDLKDIPSALAEIPAAAMPYKVVRQQY